MGQTDSFDMLECKCNRDRLEKGIGEPVVYIYIYILTVRSQSFFFYFFYFLFIEFQSPGILVSLCELCFYIRSVVKNKPPRKA